MTSHPERNDQVTTLQAGPWTLDQRYDQPVYEAMERWLADPVVTHAMGRTPATMTRQDFDAIVRIHDGQTGWLFFARSVEDDAPHAYVSIMVEPDSGVARLDIVVGDRRARPRRLLNHITRALMPWMFDVIGVRKVCVYVRADNRVTAAWLKPRMKLEGVHRGEMVMPDGTGVDLLYFGLLPDEWRDAVAASESSLAAEWERPVRDDVPNRARDVRGT